MAAKERRPLADPAAAQVRSSLADLLAGAGRPVAAPLAPGSALPAAPPPAPQSGPDLSSCGKIVLRRERKGHGGKTVTVLTGLPLGNLDALVRALRRGLGCGATVDGDRVLLQGDLGDRAAAWLVARGARRLVRG
ncbi:MAG: translation initiation factor [Candidatus Binatia bacterium]